MAETFEDFITRERQRLHAERDAVFSQQQELENQLSALNNELRAIDAYEAAKTGKQLPAKTTTRRASMGRKGSKREELLGVIRAGDGLTRGEILEKMGLKGNKSGEMSVSNALTALTKGNQVLRRDGKYITA